VIVVHVIVSECASSGAAERSRSRSEPAHTFIVVSVSIICTAARGNISDSIALPNPLPEHISISTSLLPLSGGMPTLLSTRRTICSTRGVRTGDLV
jgi:hypothetical protein